jgi:uncharacterized FlaG/YvyC family protein
MADAAVTYEIKGTSDVQDQTDKAKKSMGQMENAIEGLNKKMSSWGKDLVLSYGQASGVTMMLADSIQTG